MDASHVLVEVLPASHRGGDTCKYADTGMSDECFPAKRKQGADFQAAARDSFTEYDETDDLRSATAGAASDEADTGLVQANTEWWCAVPISLAHRLICAVPECEAVNGNTPVLNTC